MEGSVVRVHLLVQNLIFKEMSKARKKIKKGKSHSSILKNKKRMAENHEILNRLKETK